MPLDLPDLKSAIANLGENPPATIAAAAQGWADAMASYASGIVPPSTTVSAAAATLSGALATAFGAPAAAPGMESAFAAFSATVGGGMAGFTPVPPPAPVGFAGQFAGPYPETHQDAGDQIGTLIDGWMKTGSATLIAPPNTFSLWS
jgi:hypothetical protein